MAAENVVADGDLYQPKALSEFCIRTLTQHHDVLGDLGWHVTPDQLRRILRPCSRSVLETVEDCTLECSGRDLTWYTWHLWFKVYVQHYGAVREDNQLLPLPGDAPLDYDPPPGMKCSVADYRAMIVNREEAEAARKAAAVAKLRGSYKVEAHKRALAGTDFTTKLPPPKRGRFSAAAQQQKVQAAALAHRTIAGRPAVKVLNDLGLKRTNTFGNINGSSKGRSKSSSIGKSSSISKGSSLSRAANSSSSTRSGYLAVKSPPQKQSAPAGGVRKYPASGTAAASGARSQAGCAAVGRKGSVGSSSGSSILLDRSSLSKVGGQSSAGRSPQQLGPSSTKQQGISSSGSSKSTLVKHSAGISSSGLGLLDNPVALAPSRSLHAVQPSAAAAAGSKVTLPHRHLGR